MPATERTWRDQLRMHVIFGISSLVMLWGTVWMLWKDHNREWRMWQLADRGRVQWTIEAQLSQAEAEAGVKLAGLNEELAAARSTKIDAELVERFKRLVREEDDRLVREQRPEDPADFRRLDRATAQLESAETGSPAVVAARDSVLREMGRFVHEANRREDALVQRRKFVAADHTAAVSTRGIAVGEGRSTAEVDARIRGYADQMAELDDDIAEARDYRIALEAVVNDVRSVETELNREILAIEAELDRLRDNLAANRTNPFEWIARGPILDALYTGTIGLDQIWLPDMTINYNFSHVARYDRCTNCHRAIDKTAPGSAVEPAYPNISRHQRERMVEMDTPETQPVADESDDGAGVAPTIESVYGIRLAPRGQVDPGAVTIQVVFPESRAAVAGLQTGDVIQRIGGGPIRSAADVDHYLLQFVDWGRPVRMQIRRGLDQPFTSHPRLDLFVGPTSPHKMGEMGCTICHDGQGSATEFKWADHTPNDPEQALDWSRKYGWFDNHHWIFPMTPQRFLEANCLKCHHEVVDLEPSERFPDPPAPKLVEGYHLVRDYGCYGCHEINGYDGPDRRVGPDLRVEPNYYEVAAQILQDEGLSDEERGWAATLIERPEDTAIRDQLFRAIQQDMRLAGSADTAEEARLSQTSHALADLLREVDAPGSFRKVGPSLRHLASKVDFDWLYSWIREPADFRPSTRMPQFFGHHQHLDNTRPRPDFTIVDADGNKEELTDREYTERFEAIEVRALTHFLLNRSQPFEYLDVPVDVTEMPSAERGRWLFESRGCLACHTHAEVPGIESDHGPDLSRIAAKFNTRKGKQWLYSWLKEPNRYHSRTLMPDLFLEPIVETDQAGDPTGRVTDPAADIVAFLVGVSADWQPQNVPASGTLTTEEAAALNQLTTVWLRASFPRSRAERFARDGIPERLESVVKADERVLVGEFQDEEERIERQLEYVGRRSLSHYGCFGCHDIPGYEAAKPIGTPLAGWGRKDTSQLAFENIGTFLATHGIDGDQVPHDHVAASPRDASASLGETPPREHGGGHGHGHGLDPRSFDEDTGYFVQAINSHHRDGFLWQKLRMPRAYDYETTLNKRYDERLRMPKFPLNAEEREAIMTFILGLTGEVPHQRYVYQPDARQEAIVQGRHVLHKYNCAGCHVLDLDRWEIAFEPDWFDSPPTPTDYPFLAPTLTEEQIAASLEPDRRGLLHAELHGMPIRDPETGEISLVDEDGLPLDPDDDESAPHIEFQLFQHAVVAGAPWLVGQQPLLIPALQDGSGPARGTAYPAHGGNLATYLFPRVIADERRTNPSVIPNEAWGWLPPPLAQQGEKVQSEWLHAFLLDPTPIRPASVMRMPHFHMSSDEAAKLVNYFAAKSNADFPFEYNPRRRGGYLARSEEAHPGLFDDAMQIVTDGNYCVKCHSVGDFQVQGPVKTLGPDLDEVYRRLRPEFVRRWIANPQRILPYTGMPVNIPFDPNANHFGGVSQRLFPGTSIAQLDGLVDLLMNFDEYAKRHTTIRSLVREAPAEDGPPAAEAADAATVRDDLSARR